MYRAITFFTDLQDNNYAYNAGDVFPRDGLEVTDARIAELSSRRNRRGIALIQRVEEEQKPVEAPKKPQRGRKKSN